MRTRPEPQGPTDPRHWALLFTRARLRKGWSYVRLSVESEIDRDTVINACIHGRCSSRTLLKLMHALDLMPALPQVALLTRQHAHRG